MLTTENLLQLHPIRKRLLVASYLMQKRIKNQFKRLVKRPRVEVIRQKEDYDSHIVDDMPLTISRDSRPGQHFNQDSF